MDKFANITPALQPPNLSERKKKTLKIGHGTTKVQICQLSR